MNPPSFLTAGFRAFFLAAGLFAVAAMALWLVWFALAPAAQPFAPPPQHWHAHEMIWGYAAAVVAGFFLTAVPNWTGAAPAGTAFVSLAALTWLAGRMAMLFSASLPAGLVAAADLAFLPLIAASVLGQMRRKPQPRNLMLVGLLALLWSGNLIAHLDWTGSTGLDAGTGFRVGLLTLAALITVIGGRVTPTFTRNALGPAARPPANRPAIDIAAIATAIALPLAIAVSAPTTLTGLLALVAGGTGLIRLAGWRGFDTLDRPILWSLHLAGLMLAAGYLAYAAAAFGLIDEIAALHPIGIGAIGGMTLAMMTRATFGHSGRPLVADRATALAYGLVAAAALIRALTTAAPPALHDGAVLLSGSLWCLSFAIFLARFWRPLTTPRAS